LVASVVLLVVFGATSRRIGRSEGAILLAGYGAYLLLLLVPALRAWLPVH
jgi:Ca2+/Na+ antiporter